MGELKGGPSPGRPMLAAKAAWLAAEDLSRSAVILAADGPEEDTDVGGVDIPPAVPMADECGGTSLEELVLVLLALGPNDFPGAPSPELPPFC